MRERCRPRAVGRGAGVSGEEGVTRPDESEATRQVRAWGLGCQKYSVRLKERGNAWMPLRKKPVLRPAVSHPTVTMICERVQRSRRVESRLATLRAPWPATSRPK